MPFRSGSSVSVPASTPCSAMVFSVPASGSQVGSMLAKAAWMVVSAKRLSGEFTDRRVQLGLRLGRVGLDRLDLGDLAARSAPRSSPGGPRGTAATRSGCVVRNFSSGHRVFSSTSTLPPASSTSRDAHGSGSQAPSISPDLNRSRVCVFSWLTMSTSAAAGRLHLQAVVQQPLAQRHVLGAAQLRGGHLLALEVGRDVDLRLDDERRAVVGGAGDDPDARRRWT